MVRTVSLPTYAAAEELSFEAADGLITSNNAVLWADDPARAVTLALTRNIGAITSAKIGPDPWPFAGLPDVAIDVRVTRMIAGADGVFDLEGQFFVGGDGIDYANTTKRFAVTRHLTDVTPRGDCSGASRRPFCSFQSRFRAKSRAKGHSCATTPHYGALPLHAGRGLAMLTGNTRRKTAGNEQDQTDESVRHQRQHYRAPQRRHGRTRHRDAECGARGPRL